MAVPNVASGTLSAELMEAINTARVERLRMLIELGCSSNSTFRLLMEKEMLVTSDEVVPCHADTASEDDGSGNDHERTLSAAQSKKRKASHGHGDMGFQPKYAICENCNEEFDVTFNQRGDCVWHSEAKYVNDSDFWADHDEDCHGRMEDFEDDNDFAEGFSWSCCEELGDAEGCKRTKHKAKSLPRIVRKKARS